MLREGILEEERESGSLEQLARPEDGEGATLPAKAFVADRESGADMHRRGAHDEMKNRSARRA